MMKVLFFVEDISEESGGLRASIYELAKALKSNKVDISIITSKTSKKVIPQESSFINIYIVGWFNIFKTLKKENLFLIKEFIKSEPKLIHIHGLWRPIPILGYLISRLFNIKFVLSPHGMLMPYALQQKNLKKKFAYNLYQKRIIKNASQIIVASHNEYNAVKNINNKLNVEIIPHGIEIPKRFKKKLDKKNKTALFLGRINPTKGISELLEVWKRLEVRNWTLLIAGISEDLVYEKNLRKIAEEITLKKVIFLGPVYGNEKHKLLKNTDLFILPTKTENFGISVLEALAYKIPVITTKAAPWPILNKYSIGWWIENNPIDLSKAIQKAINKPYSELITMGENGYSIVKEKYGWDKIANCYIDKYRNLVA